MYKFYKTVMFFSLGMLIASAMLAGYCYQQSHLKDDLFPPIKSKFPWQLLARSDTDIGGASTVVVSEDSLGLSYTYNISDAITYPYVATTLLFNGDEKVSPGFVDLEKYSAVFLRLQCSQDVEMSIHYHSFEEGISSLDNIETSRLAEKNFSCSDKEQTIKVDFDDLLVPSWWLKKYGLAITDKNYLRHKTTGLSFDSDERSPLHTDINVHIVNVTLIGRDWRYIWLGASVLIFVWVVFLTLILRMYFRCLLLNVKVKIESNQPSVVYQQVVIENRKDKLKAQLLDFMRLEFSNPDISLEYTSKKLGQNRTKINDMLRKEFGLTYVGYLNKLRLEESVRLLEQHREMTISEVALAVGYNNTSYFNRLFKIEFGYSPKKYIEEQKKQAKEPLESI